MYTFVARRKNRFGNAFINAAAGTQNSITIQRLTDNNSKTENIMNCHIEYFC